MTRAGMNARLLRYDHDDQLVVSINDTGAVVKASLRYATSAEDRPRVRQATPFKPVDCIFTPGAFDGEKFRDSELYFPVAAAPPCKKRLTYKSTRPEKPE